MMIEVTNQPPPLENYNLFSTDAILGEAIERENAGWASAGLKLLGAQFGSTEMIAAGADANRFVPVLKAFDRYGHRLDEVEFYPSWHALIGLAVKAGLHTAPWAEPRNGAHVARAPDESQARVFVRNLVLALQAALLVRHAPNEVSDAFCATRLAGDEGGAFGLLPSGTNTRAIIERAAPALD